MIKLPAPTSTLLLFMLGTTMTASSFCFTTRPTSTTTTSSNVFVGTRRAASSSSSLLLLSSSVRDHHHRQRQQPRHARTVSVAVVSTRTDSETTAPRNNAVEVVSDFGTAMPPPNDALPYEEIGIEPEQLALGIDPEEFLKYIGTRESLIQKTLADIPSFNRAKAEQEVDKYLLDYEMVDMYIRFQKEKELNPDFKVPDTGKTAADEGLFNFRTLVILYLCYVVADTVPNLFRRWVADQEAAGSWSGTNIPFIDKWIENTAVVTNDKGKVVVQAVLDAVMSPAGTDTTDTTTTTTAPLFSNVLVQGITQAATDSTTQTVVADVVQSVSSAIN